METVSSWRAMYVPGRWVVLAGPTSVVIMQPAPAHMSGLLSDLWQDVVSAADVSDLATKFSAFRLDLMPHFAAFFWAKDGMHSVIRGELRAVDAETGDVVAQGDGFYTWNEVGLQSVRQVRVEMDEIGDEPVLALPLAVGVVLASSVTIDSTQKIPLVLPTVAATEMPDAAAQEPGVEAAASDEVPGQPAAEVGALEAPVEVIAAVVPIVSVVSDVEPEAGLVRAEPIEGGVEPADDESDEFALETLADDGAPDEAEDDAWAEPADVDEAGLAEDAPAAFVAEPSLPIETLESAGPKPVEAPVDESSRDADAPYEPSWPVPHEAQGDAWGVRSAESVVPVDLFLDENHDGIPDAEQSGLDLDDQSADALTEPVALDVPAPGAPPVEGFPGFAGPDAPPNPGGFFASPVPSPVGATQAPQGPPPGWNQPAQNPYGQPQGQPPVGMPFAAPGMPGSQFAHPSQAPGVPGLPFPGQAYPGQPYPGQPFPGQPVQAQPVQGPLGQFGAAQQQPIYPPSPQFGGPVSSLGAPLTSPVPPPAAYAPSAPPPQGPGAPSEPGLPVSADSADSDSTVFSTGIAMTHKPAAPRPGTDNLILAVVCSFSHPNPPGSPRCRVCGQPVDNANPRLVHKPVLAQLITAGGARVEVTDTVLIGRAPSAQAGDGNPILLPIPSPNSDISRTHLKVAVKDWDIVATDLHSTNGTMLVRPGQAPVRMMPGTPVTVEPGTILDLGDGGVITIRLPA
jgi:hypothetical protein